MFSMETIHWSAKWIPNASTKTCQKCREIAALHQNGAYTCLLLNWNLIFDQYRIEKTVRLESVLDYYCSPCSPLSVLNLLVSL